MQIKSLTIENFKSIKKIRIDDIENALILVGKNNTGKTIILDAIRAVSGDYIVKESDFKIVHSSVTIPGSVISIQKDLPEDLKQQVTDFLLSYDNEEFLGDPGYKFVAVEDSEYDVIRELQEKYGLTD